ncbi:MAG: HlyD family efflux transporter periplasmic adaptor subunit [Deltaproteobacteria bacterium]|nr:HlyD family efflux transporter periplasmic adaptor subunit [Deltaproteobacteria bacterium]
MKRILAVFVVLALVLGAALWWKIRDQERRAERPPGSSGIVETTRVAVSACIGARILRMRVDEGDRIRAGDVLAELDCTEPDAFVAEALARVEAAKAQVTAVKSRMEAAAFQARASKRKAAGQKAQVTSIRAQQSNALRQSQRAGRLAGESVMARVKYENADAVTRDLTGRLVAAGEAARASELGFRAAELQARSIEDQAKAAERQVDAMEAALKRARAAQAECTVKAPLNGYVTLRAREPGEVVLPGSVLYEVTDDSVTKVTFYVANLDLGRVAPGLPVTVEADAWPGKSFKGALTRVGREAEFTPRTIQTRSDRERLVYEVEARVENPEGLLRSGMPVEVRVDEGSAAGTPGGPGSEARTPEAR